MKNIKLFVLFFLLNTVVIAQEQDWILSKDTKDLKTYYRESDNSDIKELNIETSIDAPALFIFELINDVDLYDDWVYRTTEAKLMKTYNDQSLQYYAVVDFPWPCDDREMYIDSEYSISDDKKYIVTTSKAAARKDIEDRKSHVRILELDLSWVLSEDENGTTNITYTLRSDPGGFIPAWMVNLALEAGPTNTMNSLKELVKTYQKNQ